MKAKTAEKASKLLDEIKGLSNIDKLLTDKQYKHTVNVVIKQHHGNTKHYEEVHIDSRHTPRFIDLLRKVIQELESELDSL